MTPALKEAEAKWLRARKSNVTTKNIKHRRMVDQHAPNVGSSFLSPSSPPQEESNVVSDICRER